MVEINITQEYVSGFFDESDSTGVMYFAVSALYKKGFIYSTYHSKISEDVSVRLYW